MLLLNYRKTKHGIPEEINYIKIQIMMVNFLTIYLIIVDIKYYFILAAGVQRGG